MWNTVSLVKFLPPSGFFQQKTPAFHQRTVFPSGLAALGSAFPCTHLHGGHLILKNLVLTALVLKF